MACFPPRRFFWIQEDSGTKTTPLYRKTLWLHEDTIEWLAETNESYPDDLHDEINSRLQKRSSGSQARSAPPAQPPKPGRWEKRSIGDADMQPAQSQSSKEAQSLQPTPADLAAHDKMYLELQAVFMHHNKKTIADSRPTSNQTQPAPNSDNMATGGETTSVETATREPVVPTDAAAAPIASTDSNTPDPTGQQLPRKVNTQTLADARPTAPPPPTPVSRAKRGYPGYRCAYL